MTIWEKKLKPIRLKRNQIHTTVSTVPTNFEATLGRFLYALCWFSNELLPYTKKSMYLLCGLVHLWAISTKMHVPKTREKRKSKMRKFRSVCACVRFVVIVSSQFLHHVCDVMVEATEKKEIHVFSANILLNSTFAEEFFVVALFSSLHYFAYKVQRHSRLHHHHPQAAASVSWARTFKLPQCCLQFFFFSYASWIKSRTDNYIFISLEHASLFTQNTRRRKKKNCRLSRQRRVIQ